MYKKGGNMKDIFKFIKKNIGIIVLSFIITLLLRLINENLLPINILLSDNYIDILKSSITVVSISIGFMGTLFAQLAISKRDADKEKNYKSFISYYFENSHKSKYQFDITILGSIIIGLIFILLSIFLCGKSILDDALLSYITHIWVFFFVLYLFLEIKVYNIIIVLLFKNTTSSMKVSNDPTVKDREEYSKNIPKNTD